MIFFVIAFLIGVTTVTIKEPSSYQETVKEAKERQLKDRPEIGR